MKVILIGGKSRSGKDTAASIMRQKLIKDGKRVIVIHYADLLKHICKSYFGWDGEKDEKGRSLLQRVGTDIIRKENPNAWVNFVSEFLGYFNDNWDFAIIPDCRFKNEIDKIREDGFDTTYVRVERSDYDNGLTEEQKNHSSETDLDDIMPDIELINDGDMDKLVETVETCLANI